ncbi:hypothetical protein LPB41_30155 [Thalassospira sp. MA62]|nr:hypothetical protein [Thalassospira sp. MA62]
MAHTVSGPAQFNVAVDPFAKRMPFGSLLNKLFGQSDSARKRKNQQDLMSNMSHAELADLGLQRKFNGSCWYIDRISDDLPRR